MKSQQDTIAAIGTASAPAALGIVRVSGPESAAILKKLTHRDLLPSRRVLAGVVFDPITNEPLDEALFFYCAGPRTATGDDTAEIHGHGGPLVMARLLGAVLAAGARPAEPGEFTYRAFANGRIDLTQAEAVMGLIGARSIRAARVALEQMTGSLGEVVSSQFAELSSIAAHVEAGLDFPDEDLPLALVETLLRRLNRLIEALEQLVSSFALGTKLTEGAKIAIVGPPNAGKSSLFNRFLNAERAIVDRDPGTTRDVVESHGEIAGVPVIFADTAGLRETGSRVERVGIERSRTTAAQADLVLLVLDGTSKDVKKTGEAFIAMLDTDHKQKVVVVNKRDLDGFTEVSFGDQAPCCHLSAETGEGVDQLLELMGRALSGEEQQEMNILTTARQHQAISEALEFVKGGTSLLKEGREPELVAAELKWARETMSALLGKSATEEMLDMLFSEFCIGK